MISDEEHDQWMAAAQRARVAARERIRGQIPDGVELTDEEQRFLARIASDYNGVELASILDKVYKAAWAFGHKHASTPVREDAPVGLGPGERDPLEWTERVGVVEDTARTWTLLWEGMPPAVKEIRDNPILGVFDSEAGAKAELAEFVRNDFAGFWTVENDGANAISADRTQRLIINAYTRQTYKKPLDKEAIRTEYAQGDVSVAALAERYGVGRPTILQVLKED